MSIWRHLRAVGLLPFTVTVLVPGLVLWGTGADVAVWPLAVFGCVLIALGLGLVAWTIALLAKLGRGTIAPWDPTARLVVVGPYGHVRNPMITGVLAILFGESALFASPPLLLWFATVSTVNAVYLPFVEEPGLRKRFGVQYDIYRVNVRRWIPRLRPWKLS